MPTTIAAAADALATGATSSRALVEACLERVADPAGEGSRVFVRVYGSEARAQADAMDALRRAGRAPSPLAGIPVSVKDLFDVAGETTTAGSAFAEAPAATAHAPVVARLLAAGLVLVGRTNMTEFAYSGLGINPHHGTPANPFDRAHPRIPGGSSSGAAVSVADGMALVGIGTDTGGSCRIPAAMCGVVGYKPTQRRVPLAGALPLSPTLDSIGPLGGTVACCAAIDGVLSGGSPPPPAFEGVAGRRFLVPAGKWRDGLEPAVEAAFAAALTRLRDAGAWVEQRAVPVLDAVAAANAGGTLSNAESWVWHEALLARAGDRYDPFVRRRIERGSTMTAAEVIRLGDARRRAIADMAAVWADCDALLTPTCPLVAPRIDALLADPELALRVNAALLSAPSAINFLDGCSISLPCQKPGEAPVGLMLSAGSMADERLLRLAGAVEALLGG